MVNTVFNCFNTHLDFLRVLLQVLRVERTSACALRFHARTTAWAGLLQGLYINPTLHFFFLWCVQLGDRLARTRILIVSIFMLFFRFD